MKNTLFRNFVYNKWLDHKDEIFSWTHQLPTYDEKYYFNKHRWMLRAMFKEEVKNNEKNMKLF